MRDHVSTQLLEKKPADALAAQFEAEPGTPLYHSVIVHFEDGVPLQVEDRWVNPASAPAYHRIAAGPA